MKEKDKIFRVLIAYSEIALKGHNRNDFIKKLKRNIKLSFRFHNVNMISIRSISNQLLCELESDKEKIINSLATVFGIKYFSFIEIIHRDPESLWKYGEKLILSYKERGVDSINIQVKRIDKTFPYTSIEVIDRFRKIAKKHNIRIYFKEKEYIIYFKIHNQEIWIFDKKYSGLNGLPANCLGKTLSLLSGGIDSPVASWLTIKRGAHVDFLHFHTFHSEKLVLESKILETIRIINQYQFYSKIYLVPHHIFDLYIMGRVDPAYELVLFKHFILMIAQEIAKQNQYYALITGDSLGQVASQTLENLYSSNWKIDIPIFRPLIAFDKEEIVELAKKIGTYSISIQKYKDCCSLFARRPKTKVKRDQLLYYIERIDWQELINKTLENIKIYYYHFLKKETLKESTATFQNIND